MTLLTWFAPVQVVPARSGPRIDRGQTDTLSSMFTEEIL